MLILKLALVPILMGLVSLAARRWGHRAAGWLTAVPVIAAPILFVLALDFGVAFTVEAARATLITLPALAVYMLAFGWLCRHTGAIASLLGGWTAFIVTAIPLAQLPLAPTPAFVLACASFLLALAILPRARSDVGLAMIPAREIAWRMAAGFTLALLIAFSAQTLGPLVSGALLSFPIGGSVLPAFTRALHGSDATLVLIRGILIGLLPFALFFYALALLLPSLGIANGFAGAIAGVLAANFAMIAWLGWRRTRRAAATA